MPAFNTQTVRYTNSGSRQLSHSSKIHQPTTRQPLPPCFRTSGFPFFEEESPCHAWLAPFESRTLQLCIHHTQNSTKKIKTCRQGTLQPLTAPAQCALNATSTVPDRQPPSRPFPFLPIPPSTVLFELPASSQPLHFPAYTKTPSPTPSIPHPSYSELSPTIATAPLHHG